VEVASQQTLRLEEMIKKWKVLSDCGYDGYYYQIGMSKAKLHTDLGTNRPFTYPLDCLSSISKFLVINVLLPYQRKIFLLCTYYLPESVKILSAWAAVR
jgi:hypothetical protein